MPNAKRLYVNNWFNILVGGVNGGSAGLIAYGVAYGYDTFQYYDIQSVLPGNNAALATHIINSRAAGIGGHIPVGSQTATVRNKMIAYNAWVIANLGPGSQAEFYLKSNDGINAEDYDTDPSGNVGEWYTLNASYQPTAFNNLVAGMTANKAYVEGALVQEGLSAQTYMGWFKPTVDEQFQANNVAALSLQWPSLLPGTAIGGVQLSVYGAAGNYGIGYSVGNPPTATQFKNQLQGRCNALAIGAFNAGRKLPICVLLSAEIPPPYSTAFQGTWFQQNPANTPQVMYDTWVVPAFALVQAAVPGGNGGMIYLQGYSVFSYTRVKALLP